MVAFSILTELTSFLYAYLFRAQNIFILNSSVIIETLLICLFYYTIILNKWFKIIIIQALFFFIILSVQQIIVTSKGSLSYVSLTVESIIIVILSILTFHDLLKNAIYSNILSAPVFWINSGFLLFFSGNLLLHLFSHYLQEYAEKAFYELWGFHSILNIILYLFISIAFWKTKTSRA